ncbi:hypothetical protein TI10_12120 [Photorhabdus luminescens subsp. luminescens]|nr:hypothetical protein TI10_12120 [Photorhabdus luminescens subsp. luminescens]
MAETQAAVKVLYGLKQKVRIITFNNGLVFAEHELISEKLEAQIYFYHTPTYLWKRGDQWVNQAILSKGTKLNEVSEPEINFVVNRFNNRYRKIRG